MNVLVGCECSGVVRTAFRKLGHDAWSCDLQPADDGSEYHIHGDVMLAIFSRDWDIGIFHPPCTYLTVSGNKWFKDDVVAAPETLTGAARRQAQAEAVEFVKSLWAAPIPCVAIENPVGRLSTLWRKPTQLIEPYMFGHPETKKTHLWLRNLPPLVPTNIVEPDYMRKPDGTYYTDSKGHKYSRIHYMSRGKSNADRQKLRSRTYDGIAAAMAEQWTPATIEAFVLKNGRAEL